MIISHKHQFIFFAIPKTATHAIRFALRPFFGDNDEEQVGLYINKTIPNFQKIKHGHISAIQARNELSENIWESYFKFAFVRNPFDRFVSFSFYMNRKKTTFKKNANQKMKEIINNPENHQHILFRPQYEFICDESGKTIIDFVGKYENLEEDFNSICNKLGIQTSSLSHFNATLHDSFLNYYDSELIEMVTHFYQIDLKKFYNNYKIDCK